MGSCLQALADKLDSQQLGSEGFLLAIDYIFKITTLIVVNDINSCNIYTIKMRQRFFKLNSRWYADVPNHTLEENEMVCGADTLLEEI